MKITFHGAASEVTGSCFLVEAEGVRFIVDCGMFQGGRGAPARNVAALDFDLTTLDFALITHAHLDHCGLLPRLAAFGFRGPVFATEATADLLPIMLKDSAYIHEREALRRNRDLREGRSRGLRREAAPLYTVSQAEQCLRLVRRIPYRIAFDPHRQVRVRFQDAGHILGSAVVEVWLRETGRERKMVFSGDLGQPARPLVNDPAPVTEAELLLIESTYGDRVHRSFEQTVDELVETLNDTLARRRGNVIVPAFALGRTQNLLAILAEQFERGRLRELNVFVDSPLALAATEVTLRHRDDLDQASRRLLGSGEHRSLPIGIRFVEDVEESKSLNRIRAGAVIIAASGMCDAGRIQHHLEHNLARPECAILITGFQAAGTLGRRIVDGARSVRLFGRQVPVRATVHTLGGLSAHADRDALLGWLRHFRTPPRRTFVVHGEASVAREFAGRIAAMPGWKAEVPRTGDSVEC